MSMQKITLFICLPIAVAALGFHLGKLSSRHHGSAKDPEYSGQKAVQTKYHNRNEAGSTKTEARQKVNELIASRENQEMVIYIPALRKFCEEPHDFYIQMRDLLPGQDVDANQQNHFPVEKAAPGHPLKLVGADKFKEQEILSLVTDIADKLKRLEMEFSIIERTSPSQISINLEEVNRQAEPMIIDLKQQISALLGEEKADVFFTITKLDQFHYGAFYSKFGIPDMIRITFERSKKTNKPMMTVDVHDGDLSATNNVQFTKGKLLDQSVPIRWRHIIKDHDFIIE